MKANYKDVVDEFYRGQDRLLKSARITGMWDLLVEINRKNLVDSGTHRAIREIIEEKEKENKA